MFFILKPLFVPFVPFVSFVLNVLIFSLIRVYSFDLCPYSKSFMSSRFTLFLPYHCFHAEPRRTRRSSKDILQVKRAGKILLNRHWSLDMSFNQYSRKVRDVRLDLWVRLAALRSCISRVSFLEGQSYSSMLARLNQKYDFDRYKDQQPDLLPNEKSLLAALNEVEAERRIILNRLQVFAN